MFNEDLARQIPWFARIEVVYIQPRPDNKRSELAYFRGYGSQENHPFLDLFKERLNLGESNRSHNRSDIVRVPYSEIERVIVFTPRGVVNNNTGEVEELLVPVILEASAPSQPLCTPQTPGRRGLVERRGCGHDPTYG